MRVELPRYRLREQSLPCTDVNDARAWLNRRGERSENGVSAEVCGWQSLFLLIELCLPQSYLWQNAAVSIAESATSELRQIVFQEIEKFGERLLYRKQIEPR